MALHVLTAILFSPRGGSAHVARGLVSGLRAQGCEVTLLAGSREGLGGHGDASAFYGDVLGVDFSPALASPDPMAYSGPPGTAPMHPSFEERPGAPDLVFAMLDERQYELQVAAWSRELSRAGAERVDVLHLHHLTPINEAAQRMVPEAPVVGQLHGTELLMLEAIEEGPPEGWAHAEEWRRRLERWAAGCSRLVVAPGGLERARGLLPTQRQQIVPLPGGVDTEAFAPRRADRRALWNRVLVEDPQGWLPGEDAGSLGYQPEQVERLVQGTIFLYIGRFTAVKRLELLISAFAEASERATAPAGLVLVGGHPGEWEGEHPAETVARLELGNVFLAGWYRHEKLPELLVGGDAVVLTSAREQFGQLLIEGMACELPVVATRSPGPDSIVEDGRTGWLVEGEDRSGLADALVEAIEDPAGRARRGRAARTEVCERFSWVGVAGRLEQVLREAAGERRAGEVQTEAEAEERRATRRR